MSLVTPLPAPPAEVPLDRSLEQLAPKFRARLNDLLTRLSQHGIPARVAETFRTPERQAYLYGFGRDYDDGRGIVTQAATSFVSWHGFGLAADIVHAQFGWNAPSDFWNKLGYHAAECDLAWGGLWKFADKPHVQFGPPMRVSPSARAKELFDAGGLQAVWKEVGAI